MKFIPPKDAEIDLYVVYCQNAKGTFIEGAFTHKVQAEAFMRWCQEVDRNNSRHWIREPTTQPHGAGQ